jgi:hypothetical protein
VDTNLFKIHVDPYSLSCTSNGAITGIIFLQSNDFFFPQWNWNDFVPRILGAWLYNVSLFFNNNQSAEFSFFDGSYDFIVNKTSDSNIRITYFDDSKLLPYTTEISLNIFIKELVSIAELIFMHSTIKKWGDNRDIVAIGAGLTNIRNLWLFNK